MPVQANLRYRDSVDAAVAGADHVINCVGILHESGRNTFDAVQDFGARAIAEAARAAETTLTHISAIGADAESESDYARTKGLAEDAIRKIMPNAVILRPSVVFGPEDDFFNRFAEMARFTPFLPLIGGGKTKFQPVYVGDVAEMAARSADGLLTPGATYELGGPEVLTFRQCMEEMLTVIQRKRAFLPLPWGVASLIGSVASLIPFIDPPITADQVENLKKDNVVSEAAIKDGRTLPGQNIRPTAIDAILPVYLVRYRPHGQYSGAGKSA